MPRKLSIDWGVSDRPGGQIVIHEKKVCYRMTKKTKIFHALERNKEIVKIFSFASYMLMYINII